jgi:hypothetical protein
MRTLIIAFALAVGMLAGMVGTALADQPNGLLGYEGQPGNQGAHQNAPGLLGYEGQPGNQGG